MRLKQAALIAGALLFAGTAFAADAPGVGELRPRKLPAKVGEHFLEWNDEATGRLIVKFVDEAKVRPTRTGGLTSEVSNVQAARELFELFELKARPAIRISDERLAILEQKSIAAGVAPPDLRGIMYLTGPIPTLSDAAKALNRLPGVEYVELELKRYIDADSSNTPRGFVGVDEVWPHGYGTPEPPAAPAGATGGCCLPGTGCIENQTAVECIGIGGVYLGDATDCMDETCAPGVCCIDGTCDATFIFLTTCEENAGGIFLPGGQCDDGGGGGENPCDETDDCGEMLTGDCFDPDGNGSPYCDDDVCCNFICDQDAWCCDDENPNASWDELCAAQALLFCDGGDVCASAFNGGCYEPHDAPGCLNGDCCNAVCGIDMGCCMDDWDEQCVALALATCITDTVGVDDPTPNYRNLQGYLTPAGYDPVPIELGLPAANGMTFIGYTGQGFNRRTNAEPWTDDNGNEWFDEGEAWDDLNGNGIWDEPSGIWGVAEKLLRVEGVDATGQGNLTFGRSLKIGIIEWGWWEGHEDLDTQTEAGQRLFMNPEIDEPDHGTATLGITTARRDSMGMDGMVPNAESHFFPLTSINEGPRELEAWVNALIEFGPGDALSASYGPGPPIGNLNNSQTMWTIFRLASDLSITVCVAAGNDCFNLDDAPDLGDSGATVVGACSPGAPRYRLAFSNYCTDPDLARSNIVHLKAWGEKVATLGYGDLQAPDAGLGAGPIMQRSYTAGFSGTSAACPQIASCNIMLQGLVKQFYGLTFLPEQIRSAMGAPGVPPNPPPRLFGGFDEDCYLDVNVNEGPNMIGTFPNLAGDFGSAASVVLNQSGAGFDDSPLVENLAVIRGTLIFGNFFSIKGLDGNFLIVAPEATDRDHQVGAGEAVGAGGGAGGAAAPGLAIPQARRVTYLSGGDIADVIAVAEANVPQPLVFSVRVVYGPMEVLTIRIVEAFNWSRDKWDFFGLDIDQGTNAGAEGIYNAFSAPRNYVRISDNRILVRVYTIGFPGFGGIAGPDGYTMKLDLIAVQVVQPFGEQ